MVNYATTDDVIAMGRALSAEEIPVAGALLSTVSAQLRIEAEKVGRDLDMMTEASPDLAAAAKSVTVAVTMRYLNQDTTAAAMSQVSQAAGGYSVSGTYLVPGGGIFIKRAELAALGLRRQRYGVIDLYGDDKGH